MQIYGSAQLHGAQPLAQPHSVRTNPVGQSDPAQVTDELNLSTTGTFVDQVHQFPEIRQERVDALRQAISQGTYETHGKLDQALSRLLDEIA